ncbi:MAG: DUF4423 domain-containing protein [Bdellovibrionales bacterium]|nr:DUF4423 domain-containing protein [Bdellovibrionales bacterium]
MRTHTPLAKNPDLQEAYTGNWVTRSLFALMDTPLFSASPIEMAQVLGTEVPEVVQAFEILERLSLIRRTPEGYVKNIPNVYFNDKDLDSHSILSSHVLISSQLLNQLTLSDPKAANFYRTGFFASNRKLVTEFCQEFERLLMSFVAKSQREASDGVFGMTFSTAQISKEPKGQA